MIELAAAVTAIALILCGCFSNRPEVRYAAPRIMTQPADVQTQAGQEVTFEVAADGEGMTYQWYYKKYDAVQWSVWHGHDTAVTTATANATWNGMRVYCCITDIHGMSVATRAALISTAKPVLITRQPDDVTVNLGEMAFFRVEAKGSGALQYQWYFRKGHSKLWTKWKGHIYSETSAEANTSWNRMQVFCLVTDSAGSSASSEPASITVVDVPTIVSQPKSAPTSLHHTALFTVKGGTDGLVHQWFFIPQGVKWGVKMKGRNDPTLALPPDSSLKYSQVYCRLKSPGGSRVYSERVTLTSENEPFILSHPQPVAARVGEKMSFSVKARGSGLQFQWYCRPKDSAGWLSLSGHTQANMVLTACEALSGAEIRCKVTNGTGQSSFSQSAGITVTQNVDILSQPRDITVSSGENVRIRVETSAAGAAFQWYMMKPDSFGFIKLAGQTGGEFVGTADSSWHNMRLMCRITGSCGSAVYSRVIKVTVNDNFTLKASPKGVKAQSGQTAVFSVKATGRNLKYQWQRRLRGSDRWTEWEGQTTAAISEPAQTEWHKMKVRCNVTDCTGKLISSDSADVWITDALDILRQPFNQSVGTGEPVEFSVVAQGRGLRYQWYYKKRGMKGWNIWKKHTASGTSAVSNATWDGMKVMCAITDADGNTVYSRSSLVRIIAKKSN